jgi:hypothetical protein
VKRPCSMRVRLVEQDRNTPIEIGGSCFLVLSCLPKVELLG